MDRNFILLINSILPALQQNMNSVCLQWTLKEVKIKIR